MEENTYIVFGNSGIFFSRFIKDKNPNIKIIHFLDKYYEDYTCADIKVFLDDASLGRIIHSYARYEDLENNNVFNENIDKALENIKSVIIMDGIEDGYYPLMLHITKRVLKKNIRCFNLFFEPFSFLGKRALDYYKNFFDEITRIKKDNYYFKCNDLKKYGIMDYRFESIFNLINRIQYYISINLDKDINLTIENTINSILPLMDNTENEIPAKQYTYVSIIYDDDIVAKTINEPSFYYKTDLEDIWINDKVLVNRNGKDVIGIVIDVEKFNEENVPFPIERTKDIIKIVEKAQEEEPSTNSEFYMDSGDYYMLLIHDLNNNIGDKLQLTRGFIVDKDCSDIEELINKCDIITTLGNVDVSKYDLKEKYVININNEFNHGKHTTITYIQNEEEYIQMIKSIDDGLFYTGFITIDLYDVASSLNGKFRYKKYSIKEKEKIYEEFNVDTNKKIFLIFEAPYDISLYEITDFVEELRGKYKNSDLSFGVPVIDTDEIKVNIFYEI